MTATINTLGCARVDETPPSEQHHILQDYARDVYVVKEMTMDRWKEEIITGLKAITAKPYGNPVNMICNYLLTDLAPGSITSSTSKKIARTQLPIFIESIQVDEFANSFSEMARRDMSIEDIECIQSALAYNITFIKGIDQMVYYYLAQTMTAATAPRKEPDRYYDPGFVHQDE